MINWNWEYSRAMSKKVHISRDKNGQLLLKTASSCGLVIGSISDVFTIQPDTSEYQNLISNLSSSQRMAASWHRTGNQMKRALREYGVRNDYQKEKFTHSS